MWTETKVALLMGVVTIFFFGWWLDLTIEKKQNKTIIASEKESKKIKVNWYGVTSVVDMGSEDVAKFCTIDPKWVKLEKSKRCIFFDFSMLRPTKVVNCTEDQFAICSNLCLIEKGTSGPYGPDDLMLLWEENCGLVLFCRDKPLWWKNFYEVDTTLHVRKKDT